MGSAGQSYCFGPFRLEAEEKVLLREGRPVPLAPKDLEILLLLAENSGHIVTKEQLFARVWPRAVVEEGNLARHIFNLRQLLTEGSEDGSRYIETIPKRGYRLVVPVTSASKVAAMPAGGSDRPVPGWPAAWPMEFDGLRVMRLIGEGAMGQVFLAREHALERLVALKVLRAERAADPVTRARFQREALAAARIVHPNVVPILRVGELPVGVPFIVQAYVEGRTLAELVQIEGPLPLGEVRRILLEVGGALAAADAKRIVHRDVKPSNVLVERDTRRVLLTDFGIAAIQETGHGGWERLTRAGETLGDPRYASPEHIRGQSITAASDVYSLGVLAYELLTGRGPYDTSDPRALAEAHLSAVPRDLAETRPDVPPDLRRLLARCLAKRAEERPLPSELVRLLSGAPAESVTPAGGEPAISFPTTHQTSSDRARRRLVAGIVFAALLAAWGAWRLVSA